VCSSDLLGIGDELAEIEALDEQLQAFDIADWCEYDLGIVRGLAYYTGTVFEIHEISGVERALAGGGRYDNLIQMFNGPPTPAVGFGMGDVVLSNVLIDKGLMPDDVAPKPDVYVIAVTDIGAKSIGAITAQLRRAGLHVRFSYKESRKMARLMKEASASGARWTVILDDAAEKQSVNLKNMDSGEQSKVEFSQLIKRLPLV